LDAVEALVVVIDPNGRIEAFNRACTEVTGYRAEEVIGRSVFEALVPADEASAVRAVLDDVRPEHFPRRSERRWVDKDGQERLIEWTTRPLTDGTGTILQFVATGVDVSSRRVAEREAAHWRARIETFIDHAPAVVYWTDHDDRIVLVNQRYEEITGLPRDQLVGRRQDDIFPDGSTRGALRDSTVEVQKTGRPLSFEETVIHGDQMHPYLTVKFPLYALDGSVEGVGGISTDIGDLTRAQRELETSYRETISRLARAVEFRDSDTGDHVERMSSYCELVAAELGLSPERCELIATASILHDAGKIAIPDDVLLKPGPLTAEERAVMQRHAVIGHNLLSGSTSPMLQIAATIALTHHERYDGTGYPQGLMGEQIPIEGRIAAIADAYDALTSDRVYRAALPAAEAIARLSEDRGRHFDPVIFDAFIAALATGR
jgi:PAS domain S-box-containing protein